MTARRRRNRPKSERRLPGVFVVAGWLVLLLAALSLVTWRQTRGVEMERALRQLETERAIAEAEQVAAVRRLEELQSRARVLAVARDRLGMHLPEENEIVFLPVVGAGDAVGPRPEPLPEGEGGWLAALFPRGGRRGATPALSTAARRGEGAVLPLPPGEGRGDGAVSPEDGRGEGVLAENAVAGGTQ